ncbi:type II and III secretion system protein family protein [Oleidesulfovibrio sp.]|uniref:type II and III secretion system protein family protein n=1 Tax=Oleidesulfovibrio sp. TaxID=2909707 RepID=UPI003A882AEE
MVWNRSNVLRSLPILLMALAGVLAFATGAHAQPATTQSIIPQTVQIATGKSLVLESAVPVKRVSVASPEIAEVLVLSPSQIYVTGVKAGGTTLTLWDRAGAVSRVFDIQVTPDIAQLKQMLHKLLPAEKDLMVMAVGESITLAGTVSSPANMATALDMARMYAPEKVTNLMKVGGMHQIMLEVKVAEMRRSVMQKLGIDLAAAWDNSFAFTMLNQLFTLDSQDGVIGLGNTAAILSPNNTGLFQTELGGVSITGFLDVLKENGLVKVLAEPTLVCRSGENASFLAGGEIPVPVPQGLGTVAIEFKEYGVSLEFTPTVLSPRQISLKVSPEVSELDYANVIQINGFSIPGISSRRASTTVELGDGQSFAVAGLLRDEVRESIKKYPGLGDIPVLGTLFRSSSWQKSETELVIIVTPRLAKPLDMARQSLPTDSFREPTEYEFFIQGKMEGDEPEPAPATAKAAAARPVTENAAQPSGMDGDFGHILKLQ